MHWLRLLIREHRFVLTLEQFIVIGDCNHGFPHGPLLFQSIWISAPRSLSAAITERKDLVILRMPRVVADFGSLAHRKLVAHVVAFSPLSFNCSTVRLEAVSYDRGVSPRSVIAIAFAADDPDRADLRRRFGSQSPESLLALIAEENAYADNDYANHNYQHRSDHAADDLLRAKERSTQERKW
jgi:hypothetical protein